MPNEFTINATGREPLSIDKMNGAYCQAFEANPVQFLEAAAGSDGARVPSFSMVLYRGGAIRQWWSQHPVVVDLEGMVIPDRPIPMRLQHSASQGVGHADTVQVVKVDGRSELHASGKISRENDAARDVYASGKKGFPWQASMGAQITRAEEVLEGSVTVNGQEFRAPLVVLRGTWLGEGSFVDLGADDSTSALVASRSQNGALDMTTKNTNGQGAQASDQGNQSTATQTVQASSGGGYPEQQPQQQTQAQPQAPAVRAATTDLDALEAQAQADARRRSDITAEAERVLAEYPEMGQRVTAAARAAINARMEPREFALEMMRATRDHAGMGGPRSDGTPNGGVLEAALCLAGGMSDEQLQASYSEQALQTAHERFRGTMGIRQVVEICARAQGWRGESVLADLEGALRAAFGHMGGHSIMAAASTVSLPNILGNVANKYLRMGFNSAENSYEKITKFASRRDFKQSTTLTLTGDYTFKKVGKSGELEHGVPGEETYTNQLDTFGRMLGITRQDMYNDDLDALTEVPRKIGRGGKLAFLTDFWAELENNASFFTAGRGNKLTGAGSALDVGALTAALVALMSLTDPDGNPLGIMPGDIRLVYGPSLHNTVMQLLNSQEIRDPGASDAFGTTNPHRGQYVPVMTQYLSTSTNWYLIVNPDVLPVIESAFLNGKRAPTVESAQADFNTLGIQMRGYWDFGNSKQEYRGGVFNVGA